MNKRILNSQFAVYKNWPSWLLLLFACFMVYLFFFVGLTLGGVGIVLVSSVLYK
ncbi:CPBP family intramembrane glutamate endopeptidase, partial [Streptococcus agalactiae]|nr:CPBP family intramembrane metalloprotease domain-containing protein [Streptococcus agalactiae]